MASWPRARIKLADQAAVAASDDQVAKLLLAAYATPSPPSADLARFVAGDPRAHRAAALAQVGRGSEAIQELRAGMALARTPADQEHWKALTLAMGTSLADRASPPRSIDLDYPTPELSPRNGFTRRQGPGLRPGPPGEPFQPRRPYRRPAPPA